MKRRSARPFTVEVKHTRTSRASLHEATSRSRKGHDLWRGIPLDPGGEPVAVKPVRPAPVVHSEPVQSKAPAPRVLPSLVPMFSMPVEREVLELREVPAAERLPRVRRAKPAAEPVQKLAARTSARGAPRAGSAIQPQVTPAAAPAPIAKPVVATQPATAQARTALRSQPAEKLRAGERWKRRLPRVLW